MRNITHGLMAAAALVVSAACTVKNTVAPTVSGPAESALSVRLTATPDTVPQDGATQAKIQLQAFGPAGEPYPNLTIRMSLNGRGSLSTTGVVTGSDGKALVMFTAPAPGASTTSLTTVVATPIGSDAANSASFQVNIALTPAGSTPAPTPTPSSAPPVARFTVSPTGPGLNQSVFFNASASTAASGHQITAYAWDFGDGVTGTGINATHAYFRAGAYTVTLIVTDDTGQLSTPVTATVNVSAASAQIVPDFTFSPADPFSGQIVYFDSTPSSSSSAITSWVWDFGDGATCGTGLPGSCAAVAGGTASKPNHIFTTVNTRVVRLTVTDAAGGTATVTKNVVVK